MGLLVWSGYLLIEMNSNCASYFNFFGYGIQCNICYEKEIAWSNRYITRFMNITLEYNLV